MKNNRYKIGITGSIGSGKSLFCKFLEAMNYSVIYADDVAKQLYISNEIVKKGILKIFGKEVFYGKELNTKLLAEKIFTDEKKLIELDSIVHPVVMEEIDKKIEIIFRAKRIVFVEAALIYEAGFEEYFDYITLISAPRELRLQRKISSLSLTQNDFIRREKFQIPDEEKKKRADFTFMNDKSPADLKSKVDIFINLLSGLISR